MYEPYATVATPYTQCLLTPLYERVNDKMIDVVHPQPVVEFFCILQDYVGDVWGNSLLTKRTNLSLALSRTRILFCELNNQRGSLYPVLSDPKHLPRLHVCGSLRLCSCIGLRLQLVFVYKEFSTPMDLTRNLPEACPSQVGCRRTPVGQPVPEPSSGRSTARSYKRISNRETTQQMWATRRE